MRSSFKTGYKDSYKQEGKMLFYTNLETVFAWFFFATLTKIFILSSKCYSVAESFIEVGLYGIKEVCRVDIVFI